MDKENVKAFDFKNEVDAFKSVIGLEKQKQEILNVIKWFRDSDKYKELGIKIPHGVILWGNPGNGKTMIMREIANLVNAPVFVFEGEQDNIVKGLVDVFKKAREAGKSIIIIDELDLLVNKDRRVVRALQENLDGFEVNNDILVLAATNDIEEIPEPLQRNGRFDKIIFVPGPSDKDAVKLFKSTLERYNAKLDKDIDDEELEIGLTGLSCADLVALANDVVLRNGFDNITADMVYESVNIVGDRFIRIDEPTDYNVAVHEAGHAYVAYLFPEYYLPCNIKVGQTSGTFRVKEVKEGYYPYGKILAEIQVSYAGAMAEKLIIGEASAGCKQDLQRARRAAYSLVNYFGKGNLSFTLPNSMIDKDFVSDGRIKTNERKILRMLKKCERQTYKKIKQGKDKIEELANKLQQKQFLKSSEIIEVFSN